MPHSASLFNANSDRYLAAIDGLQLEQLRTRYTIMALDQYEQLKREAPDKAMQVYWHEILSRAHWTAITAIFRNRRWISAISSAVTDRNALAFAAALRGLIESAGDTHTALQNIPTTLARDAANIKGAISGKLGPRLLVDSIEDDLIHFAYARKLKKGEAAPASHHAKTIQEYIEILKRGKVKQVADLYSELCDFTHPGASSVWLWLCQHGEHEVEIVSSREAETISRLLSEYSETIENLLSFGFNGPLITLAVLNYFPAKSLHTTALANWDFSDIPIWRKIDRDLVAQGSTCYVKSKSPLLRMVLKGRG